jgi:hypothetical protein
VQELYVHAVHDGVSARLVDHVEVVIDLYLLARLLNFQFSVQPEDLIDVGVGQLLELVLLHEDLVVAIADVVIELGVDLEDHAPLVVYGGHGLVFGDLHDEVGVILPDDREVAIRVF